MRRRRRSPGIDVTLADESAPTAETPGAERRLALALLVVGLLWRLAAVFHMEFNSDETQHLHVVWAWTRGLLPYRDVFDNHSPLFQRLCAPLLAWLGERPQALYGVRLAMLPLALAALVLAHAIARRLFGARVALWTAALLGVMPGYAPKSSEFRTDDLWAPLCLLGFLLLLGRFTFARGLAAGFVLGAAAGASQKTSLFVTVMALAAVAGLAADGSTLRPVPWRRWAAGAGGFALGFLLVPASIVVWFVRRGAFAPFLYGVYTHSTQGNSSDPRRWPLFVIVLLVAVALARWHGRHSPNVAARAERRFTVLASGLFMASVAGLWPLSTGQDYLPTTPLFLACLVPWLLSLVRPQPAWRRPGAILGGLAIVELLGLGLDAPLWGDRVSATLAPIATTLRLTDPGQTVFDRKGELVFRPRGTFWVLETMTRRKLESGTLADTLGDDLVAHRTCVAIEDDPQIPSRTRLFLRRNYVDVGWLRVCGLELPAPHAPGEAVEFEVAVPARYVLLDAAGRRASGELDGMPLDGPRELAAGPHRFRPRDGGLSSLVWAQAVERGFLPSARRPQ